LTQPFPTVLARIRRWNAGQLAVVSVAVLLLIGWCFYKRWLVDQYLSQPATSYECPTALTEREFKLCVRSELAHVFAEPARTQRLRDYRTLWGWAIALLITLELGVMWVWFAGRAEPE